MFAYIIYESSLHINAFRQVKMNVTDIIHVCNVPPSLMKHWRWLYIRCPCHDVFAVDHWNAIWAWFSSMYTSWNDDYNIILRRCMSDITSNYLNSLLTQTFITQLATSFGDHIRAKSDTTCSAELDDVFSYCYINRRNCYSSQHANQRIHSCRYHDRVLSTHYA